MTFIMGNPHKDFELVSVNTFNHIFQHLCREKAIEIIIITTVKGQDHTVIKSIKLSVVDSLSVFMNN